MQHVSLETRRPQRDLLLGGGALGVPHGIEHAHWVDLDLCKVSEVSIQYRVCVCIGE